MKDISNKLHKQTIEPHKPLSTSFTQRVILCIDDANPRSEGETAMKQPKKRLTFAAAGMFGLLIIGGTAAAATLWPTPSASKTSLQTLPNGNRIIGYDIRDCDIVGTGNAAAKASRRAYYEVRDKSLSDKQLEDAILGNCQQQLAYDVVGNILSNRPDYKQTYGSLTYTVKAISANSITVSADPKWDQSKLAVNGDQTFNTFAPDMVVQNRYNPASISDIKVGDSVALGFIDKYGATGVSGNTPGAPDGYDPNFYPENQTVVAMVKVPALTASPDKLDSYTATQLVRTEPCKTGPSGFCRAYNFVN